MTCKHTNNRKRKKHRRSRNARPGPPKRYFYNTCMTAIPVDGIFRLEEKGMFGIIVLIHDMRYCIITDFYKDISRNPRLETKLEILEDMGLISWDIVHGHRMYTLTPKGEVIAEFILEIDGIIGDGL